MRYLAYLLIISLFSCGAVDSKNNPDAMLAEQVSYDVSDTLHDFGTQNIHAPNQATAQITLTNTGPATLFSFGATGDVTLDSSACTGNLASDSTCQLILTFDPYFVGPSQGAVSINGEEAITISGTGSATVRLRTVNAAGFVADSAGGINCTSAQAPCDFDVTEPTLELQATPTAQGGCFQGWTDACPGANCSMQCVGDLTTCNIDINGATEDSSGSPSTLFPDMGAGTVFSMTADFGLCF